MCRQHHADRRFVFPFCLHSIEFARQSSLHQIDQIAVQAAHNRLRFRVAEAAVEFDGERRAVGVNHQAGIQKARELDAVGLHAAHGGQDDFVHRALINRGRYHRGGAVCAHAAGVRALVAVQQAFMVLAGGHRQNVFAVHHHDEAGFFARQIIFNHHAAAGAAHFVAQQHIVNRGVCFVQGRGHYHAFARRQTVGLNHNRRAFLADVIVRRVRLLEGLVLRGGNAVLLHERFGEIFGAFQLRRRFGAAENRQAGGTEIVHNACRQRRFGADQREGDLFVAAESD